MLFFSASVSISAERKFAGSKGDPTFADLLGQVRTRSLEAFEHQDVPFEVLVERLNPVRSLTHHPLVQVMLAWQNFAGLNDPAAGSGLKGLDVTSIPLATQSARMDLTFSLAERWTEADEPAGIGAGTGAWHVDQARPAGVHTWTRNLHRRQVDRDPVRSSAATWPRSVRLRRQLRQGRQRRRRAGISAAAVAFESALHAHWIVVLIMASAMVALLQAFNANMVASSRMLFALGRRGLTAPALARVHPANRTPSTAVVAVGIASCMAML